MADSNIRTFTFSADLGVCHLLLFSAFRGKIMDQNVSVSFMYRLLFTLVCPYYQQLPFCYLLTVNHHIIRYFAIAPTLFSGRITPIVFEALYVSQ